MNRVIKFRVFAKQKDEDGCVGYLETDPAFPGVNFFYAGGWRGVGYFLNSENFIVEQYIGQKDFEGKEIYEGDILLSSKSGDEFNDDLGCFERIFSEDCQKFTIKWCRSAYGEILAFHPIDKNGNHKNHYYGEWRSIYFKIIGNILKSPELLD